ncbi:MATE family efflux transporter [bacterium]|nr:MATE family efflux transporter [bacterium]
MNYKKFYIYAKELLRLTLPMIMGGIGFAFIFVGDVFVAARYSTDVLAAVSISGAITSIIFMFGIGMLSSVSAYLSNRLGAKKSAKSYLIPSIKFAEILAFISFLTIIGVIPFFKKLGFEEKLIPMMNIYTFIFAFSTFGDYLFKTMKEFLQSYKIVFVPNIIVIIAIFVNLFANWILAFGIGPIPEMGEAGLALATVISRTFMGLSVLFFYLYKFKLKIVKKAYTDYYKSMVEIGLPISLAICIEFLAFNLITILMGRISGLYSAAESILVAIINTTFMVPMSVSVATTIKVGYSNGAKNLEDIKRYSLVSCIISEIFMLLCGIIIAMFPVQIIKLFTSDAELIKIMIPIMILLAIFEITDGLQVTLSGIFKGLKDTKIVMITNVISYLVIGLPIGTYFAIIKEQNLFGFWIGLSVTSILLCVILGLRLLKTLKKLELEFKKL